MNTASVQRYCCIRLALDIAYVVLLLVRPTIFRSVLALALYVVTCVGPPLATVVSGRCVPRDGDAKPGDLPVGPVAARKV